MPEKLEGSPVSRWGHRKVVELFGADLRSLAAFRMALAVLVLSDLASRAADLTAHYADRGVLPRSALLQEAMSPWSFSLSLMNGRPFFQALLFGVAALAAVGMLVGYRTRLMTFIAWVMLVSIQWRNPLVLNTGDTLLRMLLFWGMFLPLGAYWSLDRALKAAPPPRSSMGFLSFGTVALFLQLAFVYWFSAILKSGEAWRVDGTAVYYALSIDEWTTPIGAYLYQFPELLEALTFATLGLEAFGPFLLFFPFFTGPVRTAAIAAFMSLHYGIWLTMPIGMFSWVAAFCMVCFLPGWFWDKALPKLRAALPKQPGIIHTLKHRAARLVRACWSLLRARLSAMARARRFFIAGTATHDDEPGSHAGRASAPPAASETETNGQGDAGSTEAADEREAWRTGAAGSEPVTLRSSVATNLLALLFLLYVFCWNLTTVSAFAMPERLVPLGSLLGLRQDWGVFAPEPRKTGGWYVIPGTLSGGQQVDLMAAAVHNDFDPRGVSWEKPENVAGTLKNKYWRKYLSAIQEEDKEDLRKYFGRYVCREWNARHAGAERLVDLRVVRVRETTLPDYRRTAPQRVVVLEHSCS